jgi:hypothetical protein
VRIRPGTLLSLIVIAAAIGTAGYFVGHGVLHESKSLQRAAQGDTTSTATVTTSATGRTGATHKSDRAHLYRVTGVVAIVAAGVIAVGYLIGAASRSRRRERWHA